jgi:hypothetical protein
MLVVFRENMICKTFLNLNAGCGYSWWFYTFSFENFIACDKLQFELARSTEKFVNMKFKKVP